MTILARETSTASPGSGNRIPVMIVEDSAIIRGLISRWLREDPDIEVVATCSNGAIAVRQIVESGAEVVVLDIEMPEMDGLTALPKLLEAVPGLKVVMASTLTVRNAEISLRALSMGAADYVTKPESRTGMSSATAFREELIAKVKVLGRAGARGRARRAAARERAPADAKLTPAKSAAALIAPPADDEPIRLVSASRVPPRLFAVGSSTGGPQALLKVFKELAPALERIPTVLTQHMPATFTTILAEHLGRVAGLPSVEGEDGMPVHAGRIHVAPGGKHMLLRKTADGVVIKLDDSEPVNYCKPAVDPLLESAVGAYGNAILTLILTGMGHDGAAGAKAVQEAGGTVLAQDEETSVVWGMPGATARLGVCHKVLPLDEIAASASRLIKGGNTA